MYWLNGVPSQLSLENAINQADAKEELSDARMKDIIAIKQSQHASLFVSCSQQDIHLWSVKPIALLSFVRRSTKHVDDFGANRAIIWKGDSTSIAILTDKHYLLLYAIVPLDHYAFEFEFLHGYHNYVTGPGEGKGIRSTALKFKIAVRIDGGMLCGTTCEETLVISTVKPPAIQCISWNPQHDNATQTSLQSRISLLKSSEKVTSMFYDKTLNGTVWITDEGRAYFTYCCLREHYRSRSSSNASSSQPPASIQTCPPSFVYPTHWSGHLFHGLQDGMVDLPQRATCVAVNAKFSLIAVGTKGGTVFIYEFNHYSTAPVLLHTLSPPSTAWIYQGTPYEDPVQSLSWTSDGCALAVGCKILGLTIWSVYGALLDTVNDVDENTGEALKGSNNGQIKEKSMNDTCMRDVKSVFWSPGDYHLFALTAHPSQDTLFLPNILVLPFAKLAITAYHTPENSKKGLLLMDDKLILYNNGSSYQEDTTSTMDPNILAWTYIQYPTMYITDHWPIRYASVSTDGKYIAIAGRRGLAHYSLLSNRWKLFNNQQHEQEFIVRGGLAWYRQTLIAACEVTTLAAAEKVYQIRLYPRDHNLDNSHILYTLPISHAPVHIAICGSYLLVYTIENVLHIYTIRTTEAPSRQGAMHTLTGNLSLVYRLGLSSVVNHVTGLRGISLFSTRSGDQVQSAEEIWTADIIILVNGKLLWLCPKNDMESGAKDPTACENAIDHYVVQVLMERVEYYWFSSRRIANLRASLWAIDGKGVKVLPFLMDSDDDELLDAGVDDFDSNPASPTSVMFSSARPYAGRPHSLGDWLLADTPTPAPPEDEDEATTFPDSCVQDAADRFISIPLDFYPFAVLLEKGIIIGIEQRIIYKEVSGVVLYKMNVKSHLFLNHILRYLLKNGRDAEAVIFSRVYETLAYFDHALEILLHAVLEEEAEQRLENGAILPRVVRFLDEFPHALDVIVGCARKTEVALWDRLFSAVGKPRDLFELCLTEGRLRTATSYLIILQTLQPSKIAGKGTMTLLEKAMETDDYELCKELVRFLSSIDSSGKALQEALLVIQSKMPNGDNPRRQSNEENMDRQIDDTSQKMQDMGC